MTSLLKLPFSWSLIVKQQLLQVTYFFLQTQDFSSLSGLPDALKAAKDTEGC